MVLYGPTFKANFVPKERDLSDVSVDTNSTFTTSVAHGYIANMYIRAHVDKAYGMRLDGIQGKILSVPTTTTFVTDIDTSDQQSYSTPSSLSAFTQAHVVPITGDELNDITIR